MTSIRTLLLNADLQPRSIIPVERAFALLHEDTGKGGGVGRVELVLSTLDVDTYEIAPEERFWRSAHHEHPVPLVIRLTSLRDDSFNLCQAPMGKPTLSSLHRRDNGRCRYCLRTRSQLGEKNYWTIDHIIPKWTFSRPAEAHTFENTCLACFECNNRKGGRTPEQAGMTLHGVPLEPSKWSIVESTLLECQREFVRSLELAGV